MIGNLKLYSKNRKEEKQLNIIEEEQRKIRLGIDDKTYEKSDERTILELKKLNALDKKKIQEEKNKQIELENKLVRETVNSNYLDDSELSNNIAKQSEIQEELERLATLELANKNNISISNYDTNNIDIQETDVIEYEDYNDEHIEENNEHNSDIIENTEEIYITDDNTCEEEINTSDEKDNTSEDEDSTLDEENDASDGEDEINKKVDSDEYTRYNLEEHYAKLIKNISMEIENEEIHQFRATDAFSEEQYIEEALKSDEEESEEDNKYNTETIQQTDFDICTEAKDYSELFKGNLAKYRNENEYKEQNIENIEHTENHNEQDDYLDEQDESEISYNKLEIYTYDTQVEDYNDDNDTYLDDGIYSDSTIWNNNEQDEYCEEQYEDLDNTEDYDEYYEEDYDYTEY